MRKLILTALMTAVAVPTMALPTAASAQSRGEIRRDRQDVREEQRELRDARRYGDRRDVREERRDVREAREDLNDRNRRWGNDDWRGYRDRNRGVFARGNWNAPFRYTQFRDGGRIGAGFYGQRYWIADPWRYRLPSAGRNQRWVRHYGDVILVDTRRGYVIRVLRNFYR